MDGDWLSKLALKYLGDANRWPEIYDANRSVIEDAAKAHPGQPVNGTSDDGHWIFPGTSLTISGGACVQPATPSQKQAAVPTDCSKPLVIGARGSDEPASPVSGLTAEPNLGPEVGAIAEDLRSSGTLTYGLPYPAAPVPQLADDIFRIWKARNGGLVTVGGVTRTAPDFAAHGVPIPNSVAKGAEKLQQDILTRASHCSNQKIILAGYSQGSWVIRVALDALKKRSDWPQVSARISGIGLVADPFNGFFRPSLPAELKDKSYSVCLKGDIVCNNPLELTKKDVDRCYPVFGILCPHLRYGTEATPGNRTGRTATQEVADALRLSLVQLPAAPVPVPSVRPEVR